MFYILSAIALSAAVNGLGINCRGSSNCVLQGNNNVIKDLQEAVSVMDPGQYFNAGDHIACSLNECAFYQNTAGGTAGDAAHHLQRLVDHGCTTCGSDPLDEQANDVSKGELTVNWVKDCISCA